MNSLVMLSSITIYFYLLSESLIQASILPGNTLSLFKAVYWDAQEACERKWVYSIELNTRLYAEYRSSMASVELQRHGSEAVINLLGSASQVGALVLDHLDGGLVSQPYTVDETFPVREGTRILLGVSKTIDRDIKDCLESLAESIAQGIRIDNLVISEFTDCQMCVVAHGQVSRPSVVVHYSGLKRKAIDTPDMAPTSKIFEMLQQTTRSTQENLGPIDHDEKSIPAQSVTNPFIEMTVEQKKIIERTSLNKNPIMLSNNYQCDHPEIPLQQSDPRKKMSIKSLLN